MEDPHPRGRAQQGQRPGSRKSVAFLEDGVGGAQVWERG